MYTSSGRVGATRNPNSSFTISWFDLSLSRVSHTYLIHIYIYHADVSDPVNCLVDRTTSIGEVIDRYLKEEIHLSDHAIHLLFSANRWEAA